MSSYEKFIIASTDKASYQSLIDGSMIETDVHGHRATSRTITASDDVELSDEGNLVVIGSGRTAEVVLTYGTGVAAAENARFNFMVEYNATYDVRVQIAGDAGWIINGFVDGGAAFDAPVVYSFWVNSSGVFTPENILAATYDAGGI